MDKNIGQQVRVGIFVFVGFLLSMVVIFMLGEGGSLFERQYILKARFDDISGLRLGAPVYLAGIQVGMVEDIKFPEDIRNRKIVVYLKIKHAYRERIREDSQATITTQGLLGDKAIFISVGTPESIVLKPGEELKIKQGLSLDSFAEKGGELLDNINNLAKNANDMIGHIKEEKGLLHALVYETEGQDIILDLSRVTRSAREVVTHIQQGPNVLHSLIYDPTNRDLGKAFSEAAENFKSVSKNLHATSEKINKGEGSVGGLINDPTVYYDLMTLLGKANRNKLLRTVIRATLATNEADLVGKGAK